ncbi:MAG: Crp/Fnr family transcriptional regulator [Sphaerochaetaceae bacterium]
MGLFILHNLFYCHILGLRGRVMKFDTQQVIDNCQILKACKIKSSEVSLVNLARNEEVGDTINGESQLALIVSGDILVLSKGGDAHEVLLITKKEGDLFGISNLFLENELKTTLRSRTKSTLLFISKDRIRNALRSDRSAMELYVRFCNQKIQFLLKRIESLSPQSARARVVDYLLSNADPDGHIAFESKETLSKRLGIGRSSLFRELGFLQKQGLVRAIGAKEYAIKKSGLQELLETLA